MVFSSAKITSMLLVFYGIEHHIFENHHIFVVVQFGATSDAEVTHRNLKKKKKKNYWM